MKIKLLYYKELKNMKILFEPRLSLYNQQAAFNWLTTAFQPRCLFTFRKYFCCNYVIVTLDISQSDFLQENCHSWKNKFSQEISWKINS